VVSGQLSVRLALVAMWQKRGAVLSRSFHWERVAGLAGNGQLSVVSSTALRGDVAKEGAVSGRPFPVGRRVAGVALGYSDFKERGPWQPVWREGLEGQ